jgi:hypothetical protein
MRSRLRAGFTLIELMVAMALTMFLMIILTQCFVLALETFTGMKGLGDMQQNLRTATVLMQSDLAEDHFEGKRRLSDPNIFNSAYPIQGGYFAIKQGTVAGTPLTYVNEGSDANGIASLRATDHVLAFTVKRKGNRPEGFFTTALHDANGANLVTFFNQKTAYNMLPKPPASVPHFPPGIIAPSYTNQIPDLPNSTYTVPYTGGTIGFYSSQWAEAIYYLVPTGSTEEPNNALSKLGTPTFSLFRAQFIMVPDSTNVNDLTKVSIPLAANVAGFSGLSITSNPGNGLMMAFNSPTNAANGSLGRAININQPLATMITDPRLVKGNSEGAGLQTEGSAELVLPNVLSFQVQIMDTRPFDPVLNPIPNTNIFGDVPQTGATPGYYDSLLLNSPANLIPFSIKGIRVTLRVWDNKTRQTRQVSIVQDL